MSIVIKRAGDVVGTPDWQLNRLYENESDRMWEEMNRTEISDPLDEVDTQNLLSVSTHLETAKECDFDFALDWISKSIELIKGTPEADKLASIYDAVSDLSYEMMQIAKKAHEKWRERA